MSRPTDGSSAGSVLITGGAGFIGCNLAHSLLSEGRRVIILDNLSRAGVEQNLAWLETTHGAQVESLIADIRDPVAVEAAVSRVGTVFHLAAQVAVTSSVTDPRHDFTVNAAGTLNVLEAVRDQKRPPMVVFTSTNKVYGTLPGIGFHPTPDGYAPRDDKLAACGLAEGQPLDFASPYGCSKGAADQYVLDYARTYGIPAAVFRMSCIYGPHQFGTEDQGWVAHFLKRVLSGGRITLYGDGNQVRDVLFVDDLVDAFRLAEERIASLTGEAFNIGGGPANATSLLHLLDRMPRLIGCRADIGFDEWRTGDQPWYVSDTRRFFARTGWRPRVGIGEGLTRLSRWLIDARPAAERLRVAS